MNGYTLAAIVAVCLTVLGIAIKWIGRNKIDPPPRPVPPNDASLVMQDALTAWEAYYRAMEVYYQYYPRGNDEAQNSGNDWRTNGNTNVLNKGTTKTVSHM